jgi:molybdate transport system substrate-binding protein
MVSSVVSDGILRLDRHLMGKALLLIKRILAPLLLGLVLIVGAASSIAANVTVFAAASLKEAMDEQARQFDAVTGNKVLVSYAGSNAVARQIEAGAPADVFISADLDWMDYVDQRHLLRAATRINLLHNALVLIAPASAAATLRIAPNFPLAAALKGGRLAMANPDSVPAGKYGKSALEKLGVWASVQNRLALGENVRAALTFVSRSEAPFGIVYRTDAMADKGVRVVDSFPADSYPPIVYPAAIVASSASPAAKSFLDYLRSAAAAAIWEKYGFGLAR